MAFLTKIFKRKKKFDIPELIKNSDWIQSLCINELRPDYSPHQAVEVLVWNTLTDDGLR